MDFDVNIILVNNSPYSKKLLEISGTSRFILDK